MSYNIIIICVNINFLYYNSKYFKARNIFHPFFLHSHYFIPRNINSNNHKIIIIKKIPQTLES